MRKIMIAGAATAALASMQGELAALEGESWSDTKPKSGSKSAKIKARRAKAKAGRKQNRKRTE